MKMWTFLMKTMNGWFFIPKKTRNQAPTITLFYHRHLPSMKVSEKCQNMNLTDYVFTYGVFDGDFEIKVLIPNSFLHTNNHPDLF
jgi:hypothetical protein